MIYVTLSVDGVFVEGASLVFAVTSEGTTFQWTGSESAGLGTVDTEPLSIQPNRPSDEVIYDEIKHLLNENDYYDPSNSDGMKIHRADGSELYIPLGDVYYGSNIPLLQRAARIRINSGLASQYRWLNPSRRALGVCYRYNRFTPTFPDTNFTPRMDLPDDTPNLNESSGRTNNVLISITHDDNGLPDEVRNDATALRNMAHQSLANMVTYGFHYSNHTFTHSDNQYLKQLTLKISIKKFPSRSPTDRTGSVNYIDYHHFQVNRDMYSAELYLFWEGSTSNARSVRNAMEEYTPLVHETIFRWAFQRLVGSANQRYCTMTREAQAMEIGWGKFYAKLQPKFEPLETPGGMKIRDLKDRQAIAQKLDQLKEWQDKDNIKQIIHEISTLGEVEEYDLASVYTLAKGWSTFLALMHQRLTKVYEKGKYPELPNLPFFIQARVDETMWYLSSTTFKNLPCNPSFRLTIKTMCNVAHRMQNIPENNRAQVRVHHIVRAIDHAVESLSEPWLKLGNWRCAKG